MWPWIEVFEHYDANMHSFQIDLRLVLAHVVYFNE